MDELKYEQLSRSEDIINNINELINNVDDFINQWNLIDQTWKTLGFIPHDDNFKKVKDFRYINDCYANYIFTHQDEIKSCLNDLNNLYTLIVELATTKIQEPQEGWSPRFVVYICLRNAWLFNLASLVKALIDNNKGDDE